MCPPCVGLVLELCPLLLHSAQYDLEGIDQIVEYDASPILPLLLVKATSMYQAHLLEHRRLATLTGTYTPKSQLSAPTIRKSRT
jgi:hypothetical protein